MLNHPGIVSTDKIWGEGKSGSVILMEYIPGSDLSKVFLMGGCEKYPNGVVPKADVFNWVISMADSIKYLHTEVYMVHRDLHWGNWMLKDDGSVKLIDFGLATILGPNGKSTSYWCADPFAAPEISSKEEADFGADVFYLGQVFYAMLHPLRYSPWTNSRRSVE